MPCTLSYPRSTADTPQAPGLHVLLHVTPHAHASSAELNLASSPCTLTQISSRSSNCCGSSQSKAHKIANTYSENAGRVHPLQVPGGAAAPRFFWSSKWMLYTARSFHKFASSMLRAHPSSRLAANSMTRHTFAKGSGGKSNRRPNRQVTAKQARDKSLKRETERVRE